MGPKFRNKSALLFLCMASLFFTLPLSATDNFAITASPSSVSIPQNGQVVSTITTTSSGGFNSAVNLSASGVPIGVSVSFNPGTIGAPGAGTSTMTITMAQIAH